MAKSHSATPPGSLFGAVRRVRFTTHLPINGTRIGLVVWLGSIERGWVGKHVNPLKWNRTWRITGTNEAAELAARARIPANQGGDRMDTWLDVG